MKIELQHVDINKILYENYLYKRALMFPLRHFDSNSFNKKEIIRITNIIVDATTTFGILEIQISLTNFGAHENTYTIMIDDCSEFTQMKAEKQIILRPNKEKTFLFKLQYPAIPETKKQKCNGNVFLLLYSHFLYDIFAHKNLFTIDSLFFPHILFYFTLQ